jgi:uncharacterized repeat protein (TIGR02059 family)
MLNAMMTGQATTTTADDALVFSSNALSANLSWYSTSDAVPQLNSGNWQLIPSGSLPATLSNVTYALSGTPLSTLLTSLTGAKAIKLVATADGQSAAQMLSLGGSGTVDAAVPALQSVIANGQQITLTYNEALDFYHQPSTAAFALSVNGVGRSIDTLSVVNNQVVLTLNVPVAANDVVKLSYTDRTGDGNHTLQDTAGNDAASSVGLVVQNTTAVNASTTRGPDLVQAVFSEAVSPATSTVYLVFSEPVVLSSQSLSEWLTKAFIYKNGNTANQLTITSVSLKDYVYDSAHVNAVAGGYVFSTATGTGSQVVAISLAGALSPTDYVALNLEDSFLIHDANGNASNSASAPGAWSVAIGGTQANTIDLSQANGLYHLPNIRSNAGDDFLTSNHHYAGVGLVPGAGSDTVSLGRMNWVRLSDGTTPAKDTVVVSPGGDSSSWGWSAASRSSTRKVGRTPTTS